MSDALVLQSAPAVTSGDPLDTNPWPRLYLNGHWTLSEYQQLLKQTAAPTQTPRSLDASGLKSIDTAGATLLLDLLGAETLGALIESATGLSDERRALLQMVAQSMRDREQPAAPEHRWGDGLEALGVLTVSGWQQLMQFFAFTGLTITSLLTLLPRPWRWRWTALVAQMQQRYLLNDANKLSQADVQ